MRARLPTYALSALLAPFAAAEIEPETIGTTTMGAPQETWVLVNNSFGPVYVIDAATGEMQGLISATEYTPAVEVNLRRREIYAPELYYSRRYRGERTGVLTVYDFENLAPVAEVKISQHVASLPFRQYVAMMDDDRHVAVFTMSPGQAVDIVDIRDRRRIGEISTPGCALVMPVANRGFLQMCGDGTLQLVSLGRNGAETGRSRSASFFGIDDDPVFDKPVPTARGWLMVSYEGLVFEASVNGRDIAVTSPWSVLTEEDRAENWRPGGGQLVAYHAGMDLIFLLMHQGGVDTHETPGTEVWVLSREAQRRLTRIPLEVPSTSVYVDRTDAPRLSVAGTDNQVRVFDVRTTRLERTIGGLGRSPSLMQGFFD